VKANGQAVAQLTMRQFEEEAKSDGDESVSIVYEEQETFRNVFASKKGISKVESSKSRRPPPKSDKRDILPHQSMPKM